MMSKAIYRGFSTRLHREKRGKTFSTADFETVKDDILNHIYTIPGERVGMPDFGTRIPLLAFEPLDENTLSIIREDLTAVINYDPRLKLKDIALLPLPNNNAIVALVDVEYLLLMTTETLKLEFEVGS
jgi:phage baseplate assembly protein W